jgi:FMN phosphatase YigB (HAD superfamily)
MVARHAVLGKSLWDGPLFPFKIRTADLRPAVDACPCVHPPRPIRGLLLDACNVLYDDTVWRRWLLRLLAKLGLKTEYGPFYCVLDHDYLDAVCRGQCSFNEALDAFLISAGLSPGQAEEVHRALNSYRRQIAANRRPLTGVRETLGKIRASGIKLGVLCNCEHSGQTIRQSLLELLGESPWSAVISSRDLGCTMPEAACYQAALAALELPTADVAFVGHDSRELRGAAFQGLTTIAFNSDRGARADIFLHRFGDLVELTRSSARDPVPVCARSA